MREVTWQDAASKAREIHFGVFESAAKKPGQHMADGQLFDLLMDSLVNPNGSTRAGRAAALDARTLWDYRNDTQVADSITNVFKLDDEHSLDDVESRLVEAKVLEFEDQYTAERMNNLRTEVLSRYVEGLIVPQTTITNNFFRTIRANAGDSLAALTEFVEYVETYGNWEYYQIDPQRGDIRSISPSFTQASDRVNPQMAMYGVKVEYENYLYRVLPNVSIAELMAMLTVGWAKASAMAREKDASDYLTRYLAPEPAFDNNASGYSALGQLSGVGVRAYPNGTLDTDYDVPRLMDYMEHDLGMSTNNLIMLLPRNAWPFMNTRKGYSRFLGTDGQPLYQRPSFQEGPKGALDGGADKYGIRTKGIGFRSVEQAKKYLVGTRHANAARAGEMMLPGPMPFLPESVPNWMNTFMLPNSAFGPMRVVLTPHVHAEHRFYAEGHPLRNDQYSQKPRPVMTTDILLFDGNHPLYLIESIPPTSWTASNDEYRKSTVVMVEAYAMSNSARGHQACVIRGAVLDHNYSHNIWLNARDIVETDFPLDGGAGNPSGLTEA